MWFFNITTYQFTQLKILLTNWIWWMFIRTIIHSFQFSSIAFECTHMINLLELLGQRCYFCVVGHVCFEIDLCMQHVTNIFYKYGPLVLLLVFSTQSVAYFSCLKKEVCASLWFHENNTSIKNINNLNIFPLSLKLYSWNCYHKSYVL